MTYNINIEDGNAKGNNVFVPDDSNYLTNRFTNKNSTSSDKLVEHIRFSN